MAQTKTAVPPRPGSTRSWRGGCSTQMALIRRFEEKAAEMYAQGKIGGFLHLYIGQEAVAVGAISTLRADDYVIVAYREHGHASPRGPTRADHGRAVRRGDGLSKGQGGSMHLFDKSVNFLGGYGIVGAHLPLAARRRASRSSTGRATRSCCASSATARCHEGAFHEAHEPRRALEAAGRLHLREQPLRDGHRDRTARSR